MAEAAELQITRAWPEYRNADSFDRIGEYFGGVEHYPDRIVLRTQPAQRAGYYFLVRISAPASVPEKSLWQIQLVMPGSEKPLAFTFPFDSTSSKAVYELGLTGSDWINPKARPVAWRILLLAADGKSLASKQSFLWH
jgi:hypothetical protein